MKLKTLPLAIATMGWLLSSSAVLAQSTEQRVQQLEAQVKSLVEQLNAIKAEQAKATASTVAPAATQGTASAAALAELKDQVEVNHKEAVVLGDIPGSFRVPGSDVSVHLYGFAELQGWKDLKGTSSGDFSTATAFQPLAGSADANRTGNFKLGARTSRLGLEVATPTPIGALSGKIEFDFATDSGYTLSDNAQVWREGYTNSYRPRLRHAFVNVGPWTLGQTWSTFMDGDTLPETLDFNGLLGTPFVRQAMVRYTYATPDYGNFTVAVENPNSLVTSSISYSFNVANNFNRRPDLIARYDKSFDWGQFNVRALSTEFRVDDGLGSNASRNGFGIGVGLMYKTVGDDFFTAQYTDGNGLGRYNISFADAAFYDAGANKILFERARALAIGYQMKFSPLLRANAAYALQKSVANNFTALAGNNNKLTQAHINLIWTPVKNFDIGAEYMWGHRDTFASGSGTLSRFLGSAKYSF